MCLPKPLASCLTVAALLISLSVQAGPPVAPVQVITEQFHGTSVPDPYRYMENLKDPQVRTWLTAQAAYARQTLDGIPVREAILKQIEILDARQGDVVRDVVHSGGDAVFYLKRFRGERQFKLMLRHGLQGPERALVDPEQMARRTGVPHAINYFLPSWDAKYLVYGMSAGGSEDASLYVVQVATGKPVGKPIPRVPNASIGWLPDSQSLTFNQLKKLKVGEPDTEVYQDSRVMWLQLGRNARRAEPVFGPTVTRDLGLSRLDIGTIQFQPGSPWMLARTTDSTVPEGFLFAARVEDLVNPKRRPIPWRKISSFDDGIIDAALKIDDVFLLTHAGAPRHRILKLNLSQDNLSTAREMAVPPPGSVLEGFTLTRNTIVASLRDGTRIGIRQYGANDSIGADLALPYRGAAHVHAHPAESTDDVFYTLSGWTQPAQMWQFTAGKTTAFRLTAEPTASEASAIEVHDVAVKSHDGALVPMTILHKNGLALNADNPTLLMGYGAYGLSQTAHYSSAERVWLERGGVLAYANVRGSGAYGRDWYKAGQKATKPNTWKDGIACAQYLISKGYASPATLAVMGGSAGGIFAGRAITEAPGLFAAAVLQVGVMDAVRAEESANGITNISEFGSVKNPLEFPALLEMSTYHQVREGTAYPGVLLVHGMNDPRVDVWHSAKAAARLQAASTGGRPVLLRLDAQAGHGMGSTNTQRQTLSADIYSFLLWQMGKTTNAQSR